MVIKSAGEQRQEKKKPGKNKGELAELLSFLRLLDDSKVRFLNEDQQLVEDLVSRIMGIIRGTEKPDSAIYWIDPKNGGVDIKRGEELLDSIPHDVVSEDDAFITEEIGGKCVGGVLNVDTEEIEARYYLKGVSADSTSKTDLTLILYDYHTGAIQKLPYSIKSYLGSAPTLLNSSTSTNVVFRIEGELSEEGIKEINSMTAPGTDPKPAILQRAKAIYTNGCSLKFESMQSEVFDSNLRLVDSRMPEIIGELLIERILSGSNDFPTLAKRLSERNPLGFAGSQDFYRIKLTKLLMASFTGMVAAEEWDGMEQIHGGYIIVTADKEVLIYSLSNREMFERYLFNVAYLDNHGVSRAHYASIEHDDRGLIFKLNLSIRMKNKHPKTKGKAEQTRLTGL